MEGCELPQASEIAAPALAKTSEGKAAEVECIITGTLAAMGYDIVRVLLSGDYALNFGGGHGQARRFGIRRCAAARKLLRDARIRR